MGANVAVGMVVLKCRKTTGIIQKVVVFLHSLSSGGHVYYLGGDSLGIVGLIDASECPPTYGASKCPI